MEVQELTAVLSSWGYPALLVLLLLTGVGSPIPEDFLLLSAGYLAAAGILSWPEVFAVCCCGVVASDLMLYAAGRHLAWHSERWPEGHFLSPSRLLRTTRWFDRRGHILVLIARLVPGTRAVVFVTAGIRAVPIKVFLGYDCIGALLWVPSMLVIGHAAGGRIGGLSELADRLSQEFVWFAVFAASLLVIWLSIGREESKL